MKTEIGKRIGKLIEMEQERFQSMSLFIGTDICQGYANMGICQEIEKLCVIRKTIELLKHIQGRIEMGEPMAQIISSTANQVLTLVAEPCSPEEQIRVRALGVVAKLLGEL